MSFNNSKMKSFDEYYEKKMKGDNVKNNNAINNKQKNYNNNKTNDYTEK